MEHSFTQEYDRVKLLPLSAEDAEKMRVVRNKNSKRFFSTARISPEAQQAWYAKYLQMPNDYMFSVYLKKTENWVGAVSVYHIDADTKCAEFGRIIIDKELTDEKGLGCDTTIAACRFAFEQLNLKYVYLEVYADNIPALHTYLKAGFRENHRFRDETGKEIIHMYINNTII